MHSPRTARDRLDRFLSILKRTPRFYAPALILFVIGTAAAVTYALARPRVYRSETLILYREGIRGATLNGYDEGGDPPRKLGLRLKEMVLSRTRLQEIIDEFKLYPALMEERGYVDAVDEMRNHIAFRVKDGNTFGLSFEGDEPRRVQAVTARLAEALIAENSRMRAEQAEVTKDLLEGEKRRNERELRDKETALAQFLAEHPEFALETAPTGPSPAGTANLAAPTKSGRSTDPALLALEREAGRLKQRLTLAADGQKPEEPRGDPALGAAKTEAESDLRSAQRELADKQAQFTDGHSDVHAAKVRVGAAEQKLNRAADALGSSILAERQKVGVKGGELLVDRAALEGELRKINSEIAAYGARRAYGGRAAAQASQVVALETEWTRLNREVAEAREQRQQLEDKEFKAAMAESAATSGRNAQMVIVDPAFRPTHPAKPGRTLIATTGMLMSLVLALSLALGCALLDDRVYDRTDLERLELGAPTALVPTPGLSEPRARASAARRYSSRVQRRRRWRRRLRGLRKRRRPVMLLTAGRARGCRV